MVVEWDCGGAFLSGKGMGGLEWEGHGATGYAAKIYLGRTSAVHKIPEIEIQGDEVVLS